MMHFNNNRTVGGRVGRTISSCPPKAWREPSPLRKIYIAAKRHARNTKVTVARIKTGEPPDE